MEKLIKAKVEPGRVAIHWLGHGGFAFKAHAGDVIVVDAYLSDSGAADGRARLVGIPVKPRDVRLDYLFLTHDHFDHTDPHSAPLIAQQNPEAPVVCPPSSAQHLVKLGVPSAQIKTAMPGQALEFPHFTAHVVAAQHTEDSVGYVFEFNEQGSETDGPVVYLTGDTAYHDGLARAVAQWGPDVLLCPIAGPNQLDPSTAAKLASEIAPREVIPMHYGMFEEVDADPNVFVSLLASATGSDPAIAAVVMAPNTCHLFSAAGAVQGKHAQKQARAQRAETARQGREHRDGIRGPGGGQRGGS